MGKAALNTILGRSQRMAPDEAYAIAFSNGDRLEMSELLTCLATIIGMAILVAIYDWYDRAVRGPRSYDEAIALRDKLWDRLITKRAVAHHEAGHAVCEFYNNGKVQQTQIELYDPVEGSWRGVTSVSSVHRNIEYAAERQIAGDVAHFRFLGYKAAFPYERFWSKNNPLFDSGKAWEIARVALGVFPPVPGEWINGFAISDPRKAQNEQLHDWIHQRYKNVIHLMCRRDIWRAVRVIAKELEYRQCLPGTDVEDLIRKTGLKPRPS
jgi:hypothetical protein